VPQVVEADGGQIGRVEQRLEMVHVEVGAPQRAAGGIAEDTGAFCRLVPLKTRSKPRLARDNYRIADGRGSTFSGL
jgi:hypothetical protein